MSLALQASSKRLCRKKPYADVVSRRDAISQWFFLLLLVGSWLQLRRLKVDSVSKKAIS